MGIAVIGWQIFIFFTILISGKYRFLVAAFWVIWTLVQVYALPLSVVQFITIFLAYSIANWVNTMAEPKNDGKKFKSWRQKQNEKNKYMDLDE